MQERLSLCMIVKNEATTLPACLDSVRAVVDELVVVDTGSTDGTQQVAREYGAIVPEFAWTGDFAVARNYALQHVTGDWVLVLDADEQLVPAVVPEIQRAIADPQALVINLIRQEVGAAQSPYSEVSRLFRRHPAIHFARPYHALIDDSVTALLTQEPDWHLKTLPTIAIRHDGYRPGAIASQDKLNRARQAMERYLAEHPTDPYVASKLGALYVQLAQPATGIALLEQALTHPELDAGVSYELHYHLGIAYRQQQDLQAAVDHYQAALNQPILPRLKLGAALNLGAILQGAGQLQDAQSLYQQVIQTDPTLALGHYNLGMVLKAQGQFAPAIAAYQQALTHAPDYAPAHQNLGVVQLKLGQVTAALAAFRTAVEIYDQSGSPEGDRLRQGLADLGWIL